MGADSAPLGHASLNEAKALGGDDPSRPGDTAAVTTGRAQALAVAVALSALAAALFGRHAMDGGFIGDAWATREAYVFSPHAGFLGTVGYFLEASNIATRPLYAVYRVALNETLGPHAGFWLAWQGATCVLMSLSIYLLLRRLSFSFVDAGVVALLLLLFPAASALRLWTPVIHAPLAIAMVAFGFLLALSAFEAHGPRRLLLHGASLILFAASVLLYEVALPVLLASALLYRLNTRWKTAATRWAIDCAVLLPIALTVTRSSESAGQDQSTSGLLPHAARMLEQSLTLLTTVILPFGGAQWHVLGLIVLLPCVAALVARRLPPSDPARTQLRRWLAVLAAGLIVVALGYAIYVPGIGYYEPLGAGIANRVNAVPGIGWVLALYALIMLSATLALRGLRDAPILTPGLAALACALIAVGWVRSDLRDADAYTSSYQEGQRVLASIGAALPKAPSNSTIWTFGQPAEIAPGVPVFGNTWDMTASVQLLYEDPSLRSYVGFPGTTFDCGRRQIVPGGNPNYTQAPPGQPNEFASPYGRTYFVDTTTGRVQQIRTPRECRNAKRSFPRSPYLPGEAMEQRPSRLGSATRYRLNSSGTALVGPGGRRLAVRPAEVIGYVDNVSRDGNAVAIGGWAAAASLQTAAEQVVAIVGEDGVGGSAPAAERADVADALASAALRYSGFSLSVDASSLECQRPAAGLTVVAIAGGVAGPLEFTEGTRQLLHAACRSQH